MPLHYESVHDANITPINLTQYREQEAHLTLDQARNLMSVDQESLQRWENNPNVIPATIYNHYLTTLTTAAKLYKTDPTNIIFTIDNNTVKPLDQAFSYTTCDEQYVNELLELGIDFPEDFWPYEFVPEQPVLFREQIAYDNNGTEPYPGFADAWENHQYNLQLVDHAAHAKLDGREYMSRDLTNRELAEHRYTHDDDGNPIYYDDEPVVFTDMNDEIVGTDQPETHNNQ